MSDVAGAVVIGLACVVLVGCPKKPEGSADAGAGAGTRLSADAAGVADSGTGTGTGTGTGAFAGKYVVSAGTMYVPAEKDWASVKFKNDEAKLLGEGELTLAIDGTGRVSGSTEGGPLGAGILEGSSDGKTLAATLRRKDPSDNGLTGTLVATIVGDALDGTMKLAEFNAAVVRVATFTAKKK